MKAVVISRPGGPEVLELREMPPPGYGPEEVRVRVRATALNRADILQRRGRYPAPPEVVADVPGLEFSGEVESCGDRVREFRPGDRVMGILGGGGYAEQITLHERLCMAVPPALDWEQAAAVPEAFLTAYDALFMQGSLAAGEVVLIHAAGSGVGSAALQLALASGARPIGLCRTGWKRERLEAMTGATVLDAERDDLARVIGARAGGGVDLVLDLVGQSAISLDLEVLAERGRVVLVGLLGGARAEIDLAVLLRKRLTLKASVLRSRPLEEKAVLVQRFASRMLPLLANGRLRAIVDRVMPLEQAAEAHSLLEQNAVLGKIVLRVDPP